jgi:hypothetical protein
MIIFIWVNDFMVISFDMFYLDGFVYMNHLSALLNNPLIFT